MKIKISILFLLILSVSIGQNLNNEIVIDSLMGDLNKDGIEEKVIISQTTDSTNFGAKRKISIFKKQNQNWKLWKESKNALLESDAGGMMGDPYLGIEISNGVLKVFHYGGTTWKWTITDKYRLEDENFILIGYSYNYGRPCDYWINYDFNLITGKFAYKKEYENCDSGEQVVSKVDQETFYQKNVNFDLLNRHLKEVNFVTPKHQVEISIR